MSFVSWAEEFYPIPVKECPKERAAQHSLQKWRGALPENLTKHGVRFNGAEIRNGGRGLSFNSQTCSLCQSYYKQVAYDEPFKSCEACPLAIVRDGVPCYLNRHDEKNSPWHIAEYDVRPMIKWLEKAVEFEEQQNAGSAAMADS